MDGHRKLPKNIIRGDTPYLFVIPIISKYFIDYYLNENNIFRSDKKNVDKQFQVVLNGISFLGFFQ